MCTHNCDSVYRVQKHIHTLVQCTMYTENETMIGVAVFTHTKNQFTLKSSIG